MSTEGTQEALLTFIDKIERLGLFQEDMIPPVGIDQVWQAYCKYAQAVIKTPVGALYLVDEESHEFLLRSSTPASQRGNCEKEMLGQIECGSFGWVIERRRPALVPSIVLRGLPSLFILPLVTAKKTLGAIFLFSPLSEASVTTENYRLLTLLTKQCALVFENSFLYQKLNKEHAALLEAQDQVIAAEKMAALGRVTAGACHEILNPLNIISGHLQVARMDENLPALLDRNLENLKQQADRIGHVVKGLLHFSTGTLIKKDLINLNEILANTIDHHIDDCLVPQAITINACLDEKKALMQGSAEAIYQLFDHLLRNAREAMPGGGTLCIKSYVDPAQPVLIIEFEDEGQGIATEDIPKVFEPFFTTKAAKGQAGLGLALAYGIVKDHGGDIHIRSESHKGTSVQLRFNLQASASCQ
jgi:signal transduction histidine kinase